MLIVKENIDFTRGEMCVQILDYYLLNSVVLLLTRKKEEKDARATMYAPTCFSSTISDVLLISDLILENLYLFPSLFQVDVSHGIAAIEDLGDLLERRASSLHEDEVDPDRFNDIPKLETQCVLENRYHQRRQKV
jgi:hypothetical protein